MSQQGGDNDCTGPLSSTSGALHGFDISELAVRRDQDHVCACLAPDPCQRRQHQKPANAVRNFVDQSNVSSQGCFPCSAIVIQDMTPRIHIRKVNWLALFCRSRQGVQCFGHRRLRGPGSDKITHAHGTSTLGSKYLEGLFATFGRRV